MLFCLRVPRGGIFVRSKTEPPPGPQRPQRPTGYSPEEKSNRGDRYMQIQLFVRILAMSKIFPPAGQKPQIILFAW